MESAEVDAAKLIEAPPKSAVDGQSGKKLFWSEGSLRWYLLGLTLFALVSLCVAIYVVGCAVPSSTVGVLPTGWSLAVDPFYSGLALSLSLTLAAIVIRKIPYELAMLQPFAVTSIRKTEVGLGCFDGSGQMGNASPAQVRYTDSHRSSFLPRYWCSPHSCRYLADAYWHLRSSSLGHGYGWNFNRLWQRYDTVEMSMAVYRFTGGGLLYAHIKTLASPQHDPFFLFKRGQDVLEDSCKALLLSRFAEPSYCDAAISERSPWTHRRFYK